MDKIFFTFDVILPIILLIVLGYILKVIGIFDDKITKALNKFTFLISIPVLVFYNIYNIKDFKIDLNLILFAIAIIVILFILGILLNKIIKTEEKNKSVLLQNFFRTNASTMGLQVILLMGISDVANANVVTLIGVSVALYNMLGVIAFQIYDQNNIKLNIPKTIFKVLSNPIIIGVMLGFFVQFIRSFIGYTWLSDNLTPIYKTIGDIAKISSPIALIALGSSFYFTNIKSLKKEIILGVSIRSLFIPVFVLSLAILLKDQLGFNENHFPALIAVFIPSLAVSVAPMADFMNGNSKLAGQLIVWTTIFSTISLFLSILILKSLVLI